MRQMHHWAADIFIGSIVVHMARIFFTGAFRKPRELNWTIGITMLILAILDGFIGYSLPDDLISGTGLRIGYSIAESIPLVGTYLASFLFGGQFPGHRHDHPALLHHPRPDHPARPRWGCSRRHLGLLVRQKHTQFPGEGRTEHNVVGSPMFPTFMAKTTGFLFMVTGGTALLGAFAQINPIWQFGSYHASKISYAVQPDWYMGWLDGALRIMPSWEFAGFGHTIPFEVFLPAVVFPGLIFTICLLWPAIERTMTEDNGMHNLLDRPRDRPKRTAAGAAMFALLFMLFAASSTDVLANFFHISLNEVLWFFRIAVIVVPDHRRPGRLPDLPGDAGRARDRQAQAGRRSCTSPPRASTRTVPTRRARRRAQRARARAGAGAHRHRAAGNGGSALPESSPTGVRQVTR